MFSTLDLYGLGASRRREGLGAQPERGPGRGGRLGKAAGTHLLGQARKEAQALGNLLASCDAPPHPRPLPQLPLQSA